MYSFLSVFLYSRLSQAQVSLFSNIDFIYSPFEVKEYTFDQQETTPLDIKIAKLANLMFIAGGKGGIIVVDLQSQEIILQHKTNSDVLSLGVTQNGQFIFLNQGTEIYAYSFNRLTNQLTQLSHAIYNESGDSVLDMLFNIDEDVLYATGLNGLIRTYDISDKNNIKTIGLISTGSNCIFRSQILTSKNTGKSIDWLYLSDDVNGLSIVRCERKNQEVMELILVGQGRVTFKSRDVAITADMNFIFVADNWYGIFIADLTLFYQEVHFRLAKIDQQFEMINIQLNQFWSLEEINPSIYSLILVNSLSQQNKSNNQENFLIVGVRSKGMYIFDISNRANPKLFQQIPSKGHAIAIGLNLDQSQIYFSNSLSIKVYQRRRSNFNNTVPNIYNKHQKQDFKFSSSFYKWRCYIEQINSKFYYFGAFDSSGLYINEIKQIDMNYHLELLTHLEDQNRLINSLQIFIEGQRAIMYVPIQVNDEMIRVYDISTPENIKYISSLRTQTGEDAQYGENLFLSQDGNYIVMTQYKGIVLIDSSDKVDLKILYEWVESYSTNGDYSSIVITTDNNWIIGTVRGFGVFAIDARIKEQLKLVNQLQTLGGECITLSKYQNQYAYLSDGILGIAVIDLYQLPQISIISRIKLSGWSNFIVLAPSLIQSNQEEQFLFVAQLESGMVSTIDISDRANIKVISSFQVQSQSAQSLCLLNTQSVEQINDKNVNIEKINSIFINNNQAVYQLPLTTNILIHTEIIKIIINENGQSQYDLSKRGLDDNEVSNDIYVGETIQLSLIPVYPKSGMKIVAIEYLTIDQIKSQPLPSWIDYNINQNQIIIQVDKEGLGINHQEGFQSILLVKLQLLIRKEDFYYQNSINKDNNEDITTQEESELIFNYLVEERYLNKKGEITLRYTIDTTFEFTLKTRAAFSKQLCERVQRTFLHSIYFNPIYLQTYSSLNFQLKDNSQIKSQNHQHILTNSTKSIRITITIPENIGKFVITQYNGVICSFNTNQNFLILEGSLDNINMILLNKLLYFSELKTAQKFNNDKLVKVDLEDNVNYPISLQLSLIDCNNSFLNIQNEIQVTKVYQDSLQSQFNQRFPLSIIDIVSPFSITFRKEAFNYPQGFPELKFNSQYNIDGSDFYEFFGGEMWLQQSLNVYEMKFFGTPPSSSYKQHICINVTASNQYSEVSDIFCLKVEGLPFYYVLNKIITILGPAIGILGLWKHKGSFYNLLFRQKVTYSDEIAYCGQLYQKKVPILSLDAEKALLLFQQLMLLYYNDLKNFNNLKFLQESRKFNRQNSQDMDKQDLKQEQQQILQNYMKSQQLRRLKPQSGNLDADSFPQKSSHKSIVLQEIDINNINNDENDKSKQQYSFVNQKSSNLNNQKSSNLYSFSKNFETFQKLQIEDQNEVDNSNCQKQNFQKNVNQNNTNLNFTITNNSKKTKKQENQQNEMQIIREQLEELRKTTIKLIFQIPVNKDKYFQIFEQDYMRIDGRIKMSQIVNDILNKKISINIMAKQISADYLRSDLVNKNSCLFTCLKCVVARYILSQDHRSQAVYKYIKQYCLVKLNYSPIDWYRSIINIDPNFSELDQNGNFLPFPILSLKEDVLNIILIDLQMHNQLGLKFHSISICDVNPFIIEQVLFADALGILDQTPPFLYPSVGESLHLERQDILKIQAFKKISSSYCMKLREFFNMDYLPFGLSKNNDLPNWLNLTISQNTVIFEGIPQSQDLQEDVLIRFIHQNGYIIRQFNLKVTDEFNPNQTQDQEILDSIDNEEEPNTLLRQTSSFIPKLVNKKSITQLLSMVSSSQGFKSTVTPKSNSPLDTFSRDSQLFRLKRDYSMGNANSRDNKDLNSINLSSQIEQELQDISIRSPTFSMLSPNNQQHNQRIKVNFEGESLSQQLSRKSKYYNNATKIIDISKDQIEEQSSNESD